MMRFVKQADEIPVKNIDEFSSTNKPKEKRHSMLLPNTLRCIIAAPSNCGKTNWLLSLIESKNGLKFELICLFENFGTR